MNAAQYEIRAFVSLMLAAGIAVAAGVAQSPLEPEWAQVETETLDHFQTLLRFDTSDPPGREKPAADYVPRDRRRLGGPGAPGCDP